VCVCVCVLTEDVLFGGVVDDADGLAVHDAVLLGLVEADIDGVDDTAGVPDVVGSGVGAIIATNPAVKGAADVTPPTEELSPYPS
jgi:hypothetical protein